MLNADMQPATAVMIQLLGAIAKSAAIARLVREGLWKRYPFFCLMALLSASRSMCTVVASPETYARYWEFTQWPTVLLQAAAAVEAFWILAGHFRNIRKFAIRLLALILIISASAAGIVQLMKTQFNHPLRGALFLDQYTSLWLVLTAILSYLFFRQFNNIPIRPNAIVHMKVLTLLFGLNFSGNSMMMISHGTWRNATLWVLGMNGIVSYSWSAVAMKRGGEKLPYERPEMSDDDYEASEAEHKRSAQWIRQAVSDALKKIRGW